MLTGKEWSKKDLFSLRNKIEHGRTVAQIATFLMRTEQRYERRQRSRAQVRERRLRPGALSYFGVFASRKSRTVASSCSFVNSKTFSMYWLACATELVEMATYASPLALTEIANFLSCGMR